uniref:ENTH domain-containing protein n=1 Tax=Balaenoptera musculus TaxID=9771 RepID=A0A8C0I6E1_BALMU
PKVKVTNFGFESYFSVYILMLVTVSNLDLIQYINGTNRSVEHLADILSEKTRSSSWVVVFKALITVHHLMVHGNERFIQHLASRNSLFTLYNFLDKSVIEGYTMSTFIRRYSRYLNEKSLAYRLIAYDITKTKRGTDGVMRTMNTEELLNTLAVIQTQFDALLYFNANPDEITNGIIHAAFMLLFKDFLRLFAAYNEGILNLLGKYFDMRKNQCKESLGIYIRFLERTTKLAQFLKVAEVQKSICIRGFCAVFCISLVSCITIPLPHHHATQTHRHW